MPVGSSYYICVDGDDVPTKMEEHDLLWREDLVRLERVKSGVGVPVIDTAGKFQIGSLGVGTAASGTSGEVFLADGGGLVVGHTVQLTLSNKSKFQVLGTSGTDGSMILARFSANASPPGLNLFKSRNATIGSSTIVQDNDRLGQLKFIADDGTGNFNLKAAVFSVEVDDASPAAGDIGAAFVWEQFPGGGGASRETMRLDAAGLLTVVGDLTVGADEAFGSGYTNPMDRFIKVSGGSVGGSSVSGVLFYGTAASNGSVGVIDFVNKFGVTDFELGRINVKRTSGSGASGVMEFFSGSGGAFVKHLTLSSGSVTVFNEDGANIDLRVEGDTRPYLLFVEAGLERVGVDQSVPAAKLHVTQSSTTGAIPVLELDQDDTDQPFIEFDGTTVADGSASLSTDTGETAAKTFAIRVTVNGATGWVRAYSAHD